MPRDPVCGMNVKNDKDTIRSDFKGGTYYFCSDKCKSEFERNPETYLSSSREQLEDSQRTEDKRRK